MIDALAQLGIARNALRQLIGTTQVGGVGGVEVAIDIVAAEDEELRPISQDGVPDRLRLGLIGARAERDARQGRPALGGKGGRRQGGGGHELGECAAVEHRVTEMPGSQLKLAVS